MRRFPSSLGLAAAIAFGCLIIAIALLPAAAVLAWQALRRRARAHTSEETSVSLER